MAFENRLRQYRVWCSDHKEWEKHQWAIGPNGLIIDPVKRTPLGGKGHVLTEATGLKDKHGTMIFEGDIITIGPLGFQETCKVKFRSGCFMADNIRNGHGLLHDKESVHVWHTLMESQMQIEVVGNIFQHPDLAKV